MSTPGTPNYPSYSGGGNYAPAAKPPVPGPVNGAFIIYLLNVIAAIVGIFLSASSSIWDDATRDANSNGATLSVGALKGTVIAIGVVFALLFLFFALMMRGGRNWARIVLTVLSGLSIISGFTARTTVTVNDHTYTSSSSTAVSWIGVVLSIIAIVLMYLAASNAYFRAAKAARTGRPA
jgi:hypothetical protein